MRLKDEVARSAAGSAAGFLKSALGLGGFSGKTSAAFIGAGKKIAAGVCGLKFCAPVIDVLLQKEELYGFFDKAFKNGDSLLIEKKDGGAAVYQGKDGVHHAVKIGSAELDTIKRVLKDAESWGGKLLDGGELVCDLTSPSPGPNYYTNMLIGNRIDFERPLQSTPKSVVDRLGRGSFRSHADTQVLATRWDYRPEENGFPANRQFYLTENGKVIFYSADPTDKNIVSARCVHAQNYTQIFYKTACGLEITRTIFILPQKKGLPIATEAQNIRIENHGAKDRSLRLVYTGMFGTTNADNLKTDVIYTTVICQSKIIYGENGEIAGVSYDYNPVWEKGDIRFSSLIAHQNGKNVFPNEFSFDYNEFVGVGTLEKPLGASWLLSRHKRRGPGFFALAVPLEIKAGQSADADNFTGLVSDAVDGDFSQNSLDRQIGAVIETYGNAGGTKKALEEVKAFSRDYASFLHIKSQDKQFESYVNHNLPYQVLYQTFISRSFDQTQKGFREIGFREIQDIYASLYYFAGMGKLQTAKNLLREWVSNVHRMGYANHNFYWKGKEPGFYSDDALWLAQAVDRYVSVSGDYGFLKENCPMADGGERPVFETLIAVITYSAHISVGKHGLPIMDKTDWNDCLKVDPNPLTGPQKEKIYAEMLKKTGKSYGEALENDYSESVMNGFLLKKAVLCTAQMAEKLGESSVSQTLKKLDSELCERLNASCWKGDFFARVLFNRSENPQLKYLGAKGDGLAVEPDSDGTYFLNSFSWSVLSDAATETQIAAMFETIQKHLRTPYGFRLCTGADYPKIAPKIDSALYFQGDRENGAVFKHANMMAAAAMLKAANEVKSGVLAEKLMSTAYWIIDIVLPFKTLCAPFEICGNPRFCTQYNNSETGENIGPTLSGTSTWMLLSIMSTFGLDFKSGAINFTPLLRKEQTELKMQLNTGSAQYDVTVTKPEGFYRTAGGFELFVDGKREDTSFIPLFSDKKVHTVAMSLK